MINKILVAIDTSDKNKTVFNSAISMAKSTGASLMLLRVLSEEDSDYPTFPTYVYYQILNDIENGVFQESWQQYEQQGINFLSELTEQARQAGIDTEYTQISGIIGWEICELARDWSADLIMVGSRGLKGLKEMFLGSVSNYVTHHAPCSVLIVRADMDSVSSSIDSLYEEEEEVDASEHKFAAKESSK